MSLEDKCRLVLLVVVVVGVRNDSVPKGREDFVEGTALVRTGAATVENDCTECQLLVVVVIIIIIMVVVVGARHAMAAHEFDDKSFIFCVNSGEISIRFDFFFFCFTTQLTKY